MPNALIVSPHYDDAVFSCGALLASSSSDNSFLVLNVFSNSGAQNTERKNEEIAASQFLNFQSQSLDFLDCERRDFFGFIPSRMHRFFMPKDEPLFKKVEAAFLNFIEDKNFQAFYFPLAIGMHIDHDLCFRLAKSLKKDNKNSSEIYFYEDLPYAFIPGLLEHRLFQLGLSANESEMDWQDATDFLYTRPVWNKLKVFKIILSPLFKKFWKKRLCVLEKKSLKPKYFEIGPSLEKKNTAACLYKSQVKDFFISPQDSLNCFTAYSKKVAEQHYSERVWQWLE